MRKKEPNKYTKYRIKIKHNKDVEYFDTVSLDFEPIKIVSELSII